MVNRKDTLASFTQRADPPRHLDSSISPQTPILKFKSRRASKVSRQSPGETSAESRARGSADTTSQDSRISHDLFLTDQTRHSVVDHMLSSLNPDQVKAFSPHRERLNLSSGSDAQSGPRHLHSSSTNSDYTFPSGDSPDRRKHQFARGRRSNSSSNYPVIGRQGGGGQAPSDGIADARAKGAQSTTPGPTDGLPKGHNRKSSSKGSLGSSTSDFGHISSQLKTGVGRRSASFDHTYGRRLLHASMDAGSQPPMPSGLSQPLRNDGREPAPVPVVHGGPRREQSLAMPLKPLPKPQGTPQLQRKNSNRSIKSQQGRNKRLEGLQWDSSAYSQGGTSRRASKQINPGFLRSRNHSPVRQFSEPALGTRHNTGIQAKETPAHRPGFFRRVFGSSKGPTGGSTSLSSTSVPSFPFEQRIDGRNGMTIQDRSLKAPATEDSSNHAEIAPQTLHKKPSSFFRRRKKSISEHGPPPSLPPSGQAQSAITATDVVQGSPVSSLRKVMNPYLDGGADGKGDRPASQHASKLRGQQVAEISSLASNQDSSNIRPSQPRTLPSQEEISARQTLLETDGQLSNPTDKSSLYSNANSSTAAPPSLDSPERTSSRAPVRDKGGIKYPVHVPSRRARSKETTSNEAADQPHGPSTATAQERRLPSANVMLRSDAASDSKKSREPLTSPQSLTPLHPSPEIIAGSNKKKDVEAIDKHDSERPTEDLGASPASDYHSASSAVHSPKATGNEEVSFPMKSSEASDRPIGSDADADDIDRSSEHDVVQARHLFDGDETIVPKEATAAWLGEPTPERALVRLAYMELFDWQGLTILAALRDLCIKLFLKGEAQQVDRILDAFSSRWCACNPNHGFKAADVVHTICYSILLLNTDLHQAEIETKMTRSQFLKNILPTVRRVVNDAAPHAFTNSRTSTMPTSRPWVELSSSPAKPPEVPTEGRRSFEAQRPTYKLSARPSDQATYTTNQPHSQVDFSSSAGETGPLVKSPFYGKLSTWENQIEVILKDFYASIRQQPLPLHGNEAKELLTPETTQTTNGMPLMSSSMLRRTPSVLSKAGSESVSYTRGRGNDGRLGTGRWQSKTRSRPRLFPASTVASSRRSSFDEQSSVTSPSVTSGWSRFSSFGRTQTSLSVESFSSHFPQAEYQQSIGFANALSQAIIREEHPTLGDAESLRAAPLLEDESLELEGAPWAKEGILKHKHHLEAADKRAKDRNWVESFAVIEKGQMRLFSFSTSAKSLRQKAKMQKFAGPDAPVGGGNWADNAELLGSFVLRQTIASALPPPGYSKARPHVWALSLPTGAVHLFQVGTPEIVKEFVTTANYWSARLSKEPLVGAISNIEYGWGDAVINTALLARNHTENTPLPSSGTNATARPSLQSSIRSARSSTDQGIGSSLRPKLPGDKIVVNEWGPPQASMVPSALMEVDQLKALTSYVKKIEDELQRHNELRGPMLLAFSPRHPNNTKAMTNWERKSSHLLREIVKFTTYIDCLQAAQSLKEIRAKKKVREKELADGPTVDTAVHIDVDPVVNVSMNGDLNAANSTAATAPVSK